MIGLIVVGLFIGILVFVICLIIVVYCFVSKKRKISICEVARIANSEPIEASHAHDINLLNEIGRGRFAVVHYAQMRGSDVAVKVSVCVWCVCVCVLCVGGVTWP